MASAIPLAGAFTGNGAARPAGQQERHSDTQGSGSSGGSGGSSRDRGHPVGSGFCRRGRRGCANLEISKTTPACK
jgi:hypothetical protein